MDEGVEASAAELVHDVRPALVAEDLQQRHDALVLVCEVSVGLAQDLGERERQTGKGVAEKQV